MFNRYLLAGLLVLSPVTAINSNPISDLTSREKTVLGIFLTTHLAGFTWLVNDMTKDAPNMALSDKIAFGGILGAGLLAMSYSLNYVAGVFGPR